MANQFWWPIPWAERHGTLPHVRFTLEGKPFSFVYGLERVHHWFVRSEVVVTQYYAVYELCPPPHRRSLKVGRSYTNLDLLDLRCVLTELFPPE